MNKTFSSLVIFLLIFIFSNHLLSGSDSLNTKYGLYGGININTLTADFYKLDGIPNCCTGFKSGNGLGINAGLLFEYKLSDQFWLGARLGLMSLSGELKARENTTFNINTGSTDGVIEHKLSGSFLNIGLEPSIIFNPFGGLLISVGARLGINATKSFEQSETIVEPAGTGTFEENGIDTHSRTRNNFSGDIPNANAFQIALDGGLSYELPLNIKKSLLLVPELSYYFPLTEMVKNTSWKVSSIKIGLALKYLPEPVIPKTPVLKHENKIDTIRIESDIIAENTFKAGKDIINTLINETNSEIISTESITRTDTLFVKKVSNVTGTIIAVGVDNSGSEIPNPVFKIEEYTSNRLDPLLNYVFFDENSSVLPVRYKSLQKTDSEKFEIDSLYRETTLDIYYNLLNIVGKRMALYPEANITVTGCNSNLADEKGNTGLSQKRAESVRDYLVNVWNISTGRIKTEKRNLPAKASTPLDDPDKTQENRRVEISSDNEKILEPIFIQKIDRSANPPIVRFKANAKADAGLKKCQIKAYQNSDIQNIFTASGGTELPATTDWELEKFQKIIPKSPEPIVYSLELEDKKANKKMIDNQTLPIEVITLQKKRTERIGDYEIERFSLILFDFDKANIEGNNKKIIDFISNRIKPESEIEIRGYTDRTGDAEYNKKLSERRTVSTKTALKRTDAAAFGIGEEELLYDNEFPEGRFYCRTVNIVVRTKVK